MAFAERLKILIGEESISGFARRVELSEALIRKYLKGSEPGLSKANQIAMKANCSLEWLATGCGYLYRHAEVVDKEALKAAYQAISEQSLSELQLGELVRMVSGYQFLRKTKKSDGYLDLNGMLTFLAVAKMDEQ
ncbi:XRE family transcriptional regulator [Photobacterium sp.]|uniref:XRE family transcriptional regulator n=1 Tax=Photobacterium sp. TaxID=660 RepID=UPI00299D90CF|nr:XRE family transcriptional regulator [Photobacterium sp.]MDX1300998.1 XRE family transcriptional regulator [Photobacterium sp.]